MTRKMGPEPEKPGMPLLKHCVVVAVVAVVPVAVVPAVAIPRAPPRAGAPVVRLVGEVVVVLEGIDGSTSNTMQARYSYTDEDIAWNSTFENCVKKSEEGFLINFDKFHSVKRVPEDVDIVMSPTMY